MEIKVNFNIYPVYFCHVTKFLNTIKLLLFSLQTDSKTSNQNLRNDCTRKKKILLFVLKAKTGLYQNTFEFLEFTRQILTLICHSSLLRCAM